MRGHNSFGKFMAQYHDLKRAHASLEKRVATQDRLIEVMRQDIYHAQHILRLAGYTQASDKLNQTTELVNAKLMEAVRS